MLLYYVALGMAQGVGSITARKLIEVAGGIEAVFRAGSSSLQRIPGVGPMLADRISDPGLLAMADSEMDFIARKGIRALCDTDEEYPLRLKQCHDAPLILYIRGNADLNPARIISIVGTRDPSEYGIRHTRRIVRELAERHEGLTVVSGLAYGIDVCAHRSALSEGVDTLAVLGNGFAHMYPAVHRQVAGKIEEKGALVTEFTSRVRPERSNFIRRNRIIAGISDATLVVESGTKGGALITAEMANTYNKEVFALPGRIGDRRSAGCNRLVRTQRALLVEDVRDMEYALGWEPRKGLTGEGQTALDRELDSDEQILIGILSDDCVHSIDTLCLRSGMPVSRVSSTLLKLEFTGLVFCLPGNAYRICRQP